MCVRQIKQRNNIHCSINAYIQGIPSTPRQHGNQLNSVGNDLGLLQSFHDHILSDHYIFDKNEYKTIFHQTINGRIPIKLSPDQFFSF